MTTRGKASTDNVLKAIFDIVQETSFPPTYREIASRTGLAVSHVHLIVRRLHEDGLVTRRGRGITRGLTLTLPGLEYITRVLRY